MVQSLAMLMLGNRVFVSTRKQSSSEPMLQQAYYGLQMDADCECPHQSVWNLIVENVPASELPEVRHVLGDAVVDTYIEVHNEAEMWREMWRDVLQGGGDHSNRTSTSQMHAQPCGLPDPPAVKELLRVEIGMLLQAVRERACSNGRDGEAVLSRYDPNTVSYVLGHSSNRYLGNSQGLENSEPGQRGSRPGSCASDEIEGVSDKLNVCDIDQIVAHIKSVLEGDCEELKSHILYLQASITQAQISNVNTKMEPTLAVMREQRKAIQMDLELSNLLTSNPCPSKQLKNKLGTTGERTSEHRPLTPTSELLPCPSRTLSYGKPIPPVGAPQNRTCSLVRRGHSYSLAGTQSHHRSLPSFADKFDGTAGGIHKATSNNYKSSQMLRGEKLTAISNVHSNACPEDDNMHASYHWRNLHDSLIVPQNAMESSKLSNHCRSLSLSSECLLSKKEIKSTPFLFHAIIEDVILPLPALVIRRNSLCGNTSSNDHPVTETRSNSIPETLPCNAEGTGGTHTQHVRGSNRKQHLTEVIENGGRIQNGSRTSTNIAHFGADATSEQNHNSQSMENQTYQRQVTIQPAFKQTDRPSLTLNRRLLVNTNIQETEVKDTETDQNRPTTAHQPVPPATQNIFCKTQTFDQMSECKCLIRRRQKKTGHDVILT